MYVYGFQYDSMIMCVFYFMFQFNEKYISLVYHILSCVVFMSSKVYQHVFLVVCFREFKSLPTSPYCFTFMSSNVCQLVLIVLLPWVQTFTNASLLFYCHEFKRLPTSPYCFTFMSLNVYQRVLIVLLSWVQTFAN